MISTAQHTSRRPAGRGMLPLMLAVLAGLLAMHGLAPGAATAAHFPSHSGHAPTVHELGQACAHATEDGTPGHPDHADATCSASGVGTSYAPPVLVPALATASAALLASPGRATAATEGGRAPPDLAELQILRI